MHDNLRCWCRRIGQLLRRTCRNRKEPLEQTDNESKYCEDNGGLNTPKTDHHDANDYNVLAGGGRELYSRNQSVVGLVDFGDMVHSYTVADLAVAIPGRRPFLQ